MMTIEEIEAACDASQRSTFPGMSRRRLSSRLKRMFYPLGFPTEVRTNSAEVFDLMGGTLGEIRETAQYGDNPYRCACGGERLDRVPSGAGVPDHDAAVGRCCRCGQLQHRRRGAKQDADYDLARDAAAHALCEVFFSGTPGCCISTRYTTPLHAGCVALDGRGVLLCGDSGAGKSTLSYACARAGWTYVTDDGSYLLNGGDKRMVTGDCHQVRFRPTAAELFPELRGLEITPRATGKPSIEMPTTSVPHMVCAQTTQVDFMVFLNRHAGGPPDSCALSQGRGAIFHAAGPIWNTGDTRHAVSQRSSGYLQWKYWSFVIPTWTGPSIGCGHWCGRDGSGAIAAARSARYQESGALPFGEIRAHGCGRRSWAGAFGYFLRLRFFFDFGFSIYSFLFNLYLLDFHFNDRAIGLIGGAADAGHGCWDVTGRPAGTEDRASSAADRVLCR